MTRNRVPIWTILTIVGLLGGCSAPPPEAPNIILILVDDQGWGGTSVPMHPEIEGSYSDFYEMPNLEKLAEEGMRFSNAYAAHPMCSPTRAAIQTGKEPSRLGMTDIINRHGAFREGNPLIPPQSLKELPADELTIAELIQRERPEYATAHFGKWHLRGGGPGANGYDEHDGDTGNNSSPRGRSQTTPNPKDLFGITERANDFMARQVEAGRPFYLQVSHYALHLRVRSLASTRAKYESKPRGRYHWDPGYAAMTENLDTAVGQLLAKLDELGIAEQTYVVYTSDNGAILSSPAGRQINDNWPLSGEKTQVREGGIRVPLIVRGPGVEPSSFHHGPVVSYDFYPTVCDWLDLDPETCGDVDGGSLESVLTAGGRGTVRRPREELVWHYPHYQPERGTTPQTAIRLGDLKLIRYYFPPVEMLFDLASDPGESYDLTAQDPQMGNELGRRLDSYLEDVGAPMVRTNPQYTPPAGEEPEAG